MAAPRRTYIVSVYRDDPVVLVESVHREERERLTSLDQLPGLIRRWEADEQSREAKEVVRP